ncbi:MAG TPA: PAS domain S-box protein [Deltaproteobacteria bacterium]|nr:PAS domain S-box protein [Deltaproteobacteria bacterium]HPR55914.1 PAS domain S-box protein [Deltaproteobacteria bacterium]HXK47807.1 PAS domain S-box protein [Deltaproteobacteria bacterium]
MSSEAKTREQLIDELNQARRIIAELESSLADARESLSECEERIRIHSQLSNDIFFSYDTSLKVLSVTPNVKRIVGYEPDELVGKNFNDLQIIVHPDDVDEAMDSAQHVLSGKTIYPNIYRFFTKDGQKRFAEVNGISVIKDGKVAAMVSRASDITRHVEMERTLRENEESYRKTLQKLPEAIGIIRISDFCILYVNDGFSRLTGYLSEEATGRNLFDLKLASNGTDNDAFRKACGEKREVSLREYRCRRKDDTFVDVLLSWKLLQYEGNDCVVISMTDISSLGRSREDSEVMNGQAIREQRIDAVRTLAGGIAHDFNNLLTTILGYTRMAVRDVSGIAKDGGDISVVRDELNEVRRSALRAKDLVNQLLVFSRHSHGKYAPIVLGDAVRETLRMLQTILPSNIEIQENISEQGLVLGNTILIHQAVMNLCTNAINAMEGRGGVLGVGVETTCIEDGSADNDPCLPPGRYVRLTIHDTGAGMAPGIQKKIFEPYFTTRWRGRGTGLGLSVLHGIARDHGGAVVCSSRPGGGTVFEVYLPEIVCESGEVDALVDMVNARGNETILIIDDEVTVMEPVNRTLENLGYTVVTKRRGIDALEDFRRNPARYDLVIADLDMPDIQGDMLARKLSEIRQDIPIIVCGMKGKAVPHGDMKGQGVRECIMKPFELRGLARTVRKVLDRENHLAGEE